MSKLTLTVDPDIIKQAKIYTASQQKSLSKLVENYLKTLPQLVTDKYSKPKLTGLVAELAGLMDSESLTDENSDYASYLQGKYQ